MKICIVVHSPVGNFKSTVHDWTEKEYSSFLNCIKDDEVNYLTLDTENGKSIFRGDVLKNCVISIENISE